MLTIAKQLCRALAAAEAENVVHGRLTPRQIHLGYDGVLRVGDFALAAVERRIREHLPAPAELTSRAPQLAGATVGAPEYMSPEQLIGEAPSASADLYAAGVVLYECVTGATPFRTDSPLAFLAQKLGGAETAGADVLQTSRPSRSVVAPLLRDLIARMIAPEADRRPPSAGALLTLDRARRLSRSATAAAAAGRESRRPGSRRCAGSRRRCPFASARRANRSRSSPCSST